MKQIIGYIEYDYMSIKSGILYMIAVFEAITLVFATRSGAGAVGYMLFAALILAGTTFGAAKQAVPFTSLVPGNILQKVLGRYLSGVLCVILCTLLGMTTAGVVKLAGHDNGKMELPVLSGLVGLTLLFLAVQNVMLYLLIPYLGVQFTSLVRTVPGFILFFFVMNINNTEIMSAILQYGDVLGFILLGIGAASIAAAVFVSCLIIRNRDNE